MQSTNASEAIAQQTLALFFDPETRAFSRSKLEINLKGLAQVIAMMGEVGAIKAPLPSPERFVDLQYLRAAGGGLGPIQDRSGQGKKIVGRHGQANIMRPRYHCGMAVASQSSPPPLIPSPSVTGQIPFDHTERIDALSVPSPSRRASSPREGIKLELVPIAGGTDKMVAALDRGARGCYPDRHIIVCPSLAPCFSL